VASSVRTHASTEVLVAPLRIVLYVVVGVGMIGAGLYAGSQAREGCSVELSMATMVGSIDVLRQARGPQPSFSDQTAKRLMVVLAMVLIVVGVGLLVGSVVSLST
jgi:hypothetical protein